MTWEPQTKHEQHHEEIIALNVTETQLSKLKLQREKLCSAIERLKENDVGRPAIHIMEYGIKQLEEAFETLNVKIK